MVKNELIPFISGNNNRYFYDPHLREIFVFNEDFYQTREILCNKNRGPNDLYKPLKGKDVEYRIANIGQITFEMTEICNLNCLYCTYGKLYSTLNRKNTTISFN